MSDLMRDVDEMMRQEKLNSLWKQWGNWLIGGVLALILVVGAYQVYQSWYRTKAEGNTEGLYAAMKDKNAAEKLRDFTEHKEGNVAALSRFLEASKLVTDGKSDQAIEMLAQTRNDASVSKDLRDMATLQWVRLSAGKPGANADALLAALSPLAQDDAQPTAWQARIEAAAITADLKKDPNTAITQLEGIVAHPALPETQKERAQALINVYRQRLGTQGTK